MNSKQLAIGNVVLSDGALLAPMAGVTDLPFRQVCRRLGAALTYTEMISAKGMYYANEKSMLLRAESTHPCAVQIFGDDGILMRDMVQQYLNEYDIVDVNMGCPVPKIVKSGYGSAMMRTPELAAQVIRTLADGLHQPVTVKIRKGWDDNSVNAVEFAKRMEDSGAAAITVHGRTREQYYQGQADWEIIRQVKQALQIPVVGNGDVNSAAAAQDMLAQTGCDAVMVGRAAQGNPWIFADIRAALQGLSSVPVSGMDRYLTALGQMQDMLRLKGPHLTVLQMKKHLGWYLAGIRGAAQYRQQIMRAESVTEMFSCFAAALGLDPQELPDPEKTE